MSCDEYHNVPSEHGCLACSEIPDPPCRVCLEMFEKQHAERDANQSECDADMESGRYDP
jgi:hypothetical protein